MVIELINVPRASEVKMPKRQVQLTKNICRWGNHTLANLLAALCIRQYPSEHRKVPRKKNQVFTLMSIRTLSPSIVRTSPKLGRGTGEGAHFEPLAIEQVVGGENCQ